jgi:hypothetical protein
MFERKLSNDKIIIRIAGAALVILFLVSARIYNPSSSDLMTCQFKNLTGYNCPTCGMSRSIHYFSLFHFWDSLKYNPLSFVAMIGLIFLFLKIIFELITRKEIHLKKKTYPGKQIGIILLIMVLLNWFYKLFF